MSAAGALAAAARLDDPAAKQAAYEAALAESVQAGDVGRLTAWAEHGEVTDMHLRRGERDARLACARKRARTTWERSG